MVQDHQDELWSTVAFVASKYNESARGTHEKGRTLQKFM